MKQIYYSNAMQNDSRVVLVSRELKYIYDNLEDKFTTKAIKLRTVVDKVPMKIHEVNRILHANISPMQYIDVMGNAKIYQCASNVI